MKYNEINDAILVSQQCFDVILSIDNEWLYPISRHDNL